jgi:lipid-binding SYLF domain-containing protein
LLPAVLSIPDYPQCTEMQPMTRRLLAAIACLAGLLPLAARAQTEQQTLVDRATLSVQEMLSDSAPSDIRKLVRHARGALICPQVFKAGFFFGGEGGGCVMVGRLQSGWTAPAFYGMGNGSFGLQFGIQDAEILLIVLTEKGLHALVDSQFKFGANAGIAIATFGGGVEGLTTAALHADIVAFQRSRGLFAGIAFDGGLIGSRSAWNQAYYGHPIGAQEIILQGEGSNPGAEPLREVLGRYSGG